MVADKPGTDRPEGAVRTEAVTVLGIDPGSRRMGWAVVERHGEQVRRLASGVIRQDARLPLVERLGVIHRESSVLLDTYAPDELAIETAFVRDNVRTALVLGQARGIPIGLAAARSVAVHEYAPALVKRHVAGSGRATKEQIRAMVLLLLGLQEALAEDEADALAIALTHARVVRMAPLLAGAGNTAASALQAAAAQPMTATRAWYAALVAGAASGRRGTRRGR